MAKIKAVFIDAKNQQFKEIIIDEPYKFEEILGLKEGIDCDGMRLKPNHYVRFDDGGFGAYPYGFFIPDCLYPIYGNGIITGSNGPLEDNVTYSVDEIKDLVKFFKKENINAGKS